MIFKKLFSPDPFQESAHSAYVKLVEAARRPFFYEQGQVPDTLDGRFDVIVLHMFILTMRLKGESQEMLRAVWEVFFSDMDRSLREMGASDTGIGKRVKKMVQAFYGRIDSYEQTINDEAAFKESLQRNLYRGTEVSEQSLSKIFQYTQKNISALKAQDTAEITSGNLQFSE